MGRFCQVEIRWLEELIIMKRDPPPPDNVLEEVLRHRTGPSTDEGTA